MRKLSRFLWRFAQFLVALIIIATFYIITRDAAPLNDAELMRMTDRLNEMSQTSVPHKRLMANDIYAANAALLAKVESGTELTLEESKIYRSLIQSTLFQKQKILSLVDSSLTVLPDMGMDKMNNVDVMGIAGMHDHHDTSASNNLSALLDELTKVESASGPLAPLIRIKNTNAAYKDLLDILPHLSVAVQSIDLPLAPPASWPDADLGAKFNAVLAAFKLAQFAPVNSPAYAAALHAGLGAYDALVLAVQARIVAKTNSAERHIAGRFMAMQTLAPSLEMDLHIRFPRTH
jgi:hypothetical protein